MLEVLEPCLKVQRRVWHFRSLETPLMNGIRGGKCMITWIHHGVNCTLKGNRKLARGQYRLHHPSAILLRRKAVGFIRDGENVTQRSRMIVGR